MLETRVRMLFVGVVVALAAITVGACGGEDDQSTPTATATGTATVDTPTATSEPTQTPTASIEDEVAEAYLAHWDAYADAVLNLDISLVEDYATGEELEAIRDEIEQLRADGVALRVVVEHDFVVASVEDSRAVVLDEIVSNSFYVDPETKQPDEGEGSGDVLRYATHLKRIDGRWVVARVEQERSD